MANSGCFQWQEWTDKQFQEISGFFGIKNLSWKIKTALEIADQNYLTNSQMTAPRLKKVKNNRKALLESCHNLLKAMSNIDDFTLHYLFAAQHYSYVFNFLDRLQRDVDKLLPLLEKSPEPQDPGGRPPEIAFPNLVYDLGGIYFHITQKKPTVTWNDYNNKFSGHFFEFAELFCEITGVKDYTNASLGRIIQKLSAFEDWQNRFESLSTLSTILE